MRNIFLDGVFEVSVKSLKMLQSLDCLAEILLPHPASIDFDSVATVDFIVKLLSKDPSVPVSRTGETLPHRQSFQHWREFLHELMSSSYWRRAAGDILGCLGSKKFGDGMAAGFLLSVSKPSERGNLTACDAGSTRAGLLDNPLSTSPAVLGGWMPPVILHFEHLCSLR